MAKCPARGLTIVVVVPLHRSTLLPQSRTIPNFVRKSRPRRRLRPSDGTTLKLTRNADPPNVIGTVARMLLSNVPPLPNLYLSLSGWV